jgi:hypothetical protein
MRIQKFKIQDLRLATRILRIISLCFDELALRSSVKRIVHGFLFKRKIRKEIAKFAKEFFALVSHSVRNVSLGRKNVQQKLLHAVGMQPILFITNGIIIKMQKTLNKYGLYLFAFSASNSADSAVKNLKS